MGKWSFINAVNMDANDKMRKMVDVLTDIEIDVMYSNANINESEAFLLSSYWGSSGDGWFCIDNSQHPDHEETPVVFYCDYVKARNNGVYLANCFKRATIMAINLGLRNLALNPEPFKVPVTKTVYTINNLDDRGFADLVNELTAIGKDFGTSQQLRARIADKLSTVIKPSVKEVKND